MAALFFKKVVSLSSKLVGTRKFVGSMKPNMASDFKSQLIFFYHAKTINFKYFYVIHMEEKVFF